MALMFYLFLMSHTVSDFNCCLPQDVVAYRIVERPGDTEYFYINPTSGVITLRRVWPGGDKVDYAVSIGNRGTSLRGTPQRTRANGHRSCVR